jgi:hypothetical protein
MAKKIYVVFMEDYEPRDMTKYDVGIWDNFDDAWDHAKRVIGHPLDTTKRAAKHDIESWGYTSFSTEEEFDDDLNFGEATAAYIQETTINSQIQI